MNTTEDLPDNNVGNGACADKSTAAARCGPPSRKPTGTRATTGSSSTFPAKGVPVIHVSVRPAADHLGACGTLTIDGYTQPGSRVNSAPSLTNGRPGVEVRGNGVRVPTRRASTSRRAATPSAAWRSATSIAGIMIDGKNAPVGNKVIGNWIGFTASGTDTPPATSSAS